MLSYSHNETMNKHHRIWQPILFVLIANLFVTQVAFAQKIKVRKTKGNSAIIESTIPLEEGQTYDLQTESIVQDVNYKTSGFKSRQNSMTVGGSFVTLKADDYSKLAYSLQGRYGWNFTAVEFGIVGQVNSTDVGAGATTDFSLGGYFDYNLISNRDPQSFIYGPFALATYGTTQYPATTGGGSTTTLEGNVGGFLTYFIANSSTGLRVEGYFDYLNVVTSLKQTGISGFGMRGLLIFYF